MREFIGEDVSACGFGGRNAAPVVLALRKLQCAISNQARSQWCSINFAPHQDLFPPTTSDSSGKKPPPRLCSVRLEFIQCPYGGLFYTTEHVSWQQKCRVLPGMRKHYSDTNNSVARRGQILYNSYCVHDSIVTRLSLGCVWGLAVNTP